MITADFRRLLSELQAASPPDFDVALVFGDAGDFPAARDYAFCSWDPETRMATITVAPKIVKAGGYRVLALLMHELAHAFLMSADVEHDERDCDAVAEELFGFQIRYDAEDVQTISRAQGIHRRRPAHLPNPRG